MRVTKEQITKIRKLSKKGKTQREISEIMNLPINTIQYWVNETSRKKGIERAKRWYQKQPKEKRKELNAKQRDYRKNYYKNRYHTDEEYKKRRIEYSKKGNMKKFIQSKRRSEVRNEKSKS